MTTPPRTHKGGVIRAPLILPALPPPYRLPRDYTPEMRDRVREISYMDLAALVVAVERPVWPPTFDLAIAAQDLARRMN